MGAQRKRTLHPGGRLTASATAIAPIGGAVAAMGLSFANPLGLAAGFDRTGELVPSLIAHGFGHIEIGTVTPEGGYVELPWSVRSRTRIGVNIGSAKPGLDERIMDDYVATLRRVFASADFIVVNLSAPTLSRTGNTPGVETLIKRLGVTRNVLSAISGRRVPLLVKLDAGQHRATFPAAIMAVKACALDGVILVSDCIRRLNAISAYLEGLTVISVGGVKSVEDVRARIAARAALVQMHRGYADGGPAQLRRILKGLAAPALERRA